MDDDGRSKNSFFSRFSHKISGENVDEEVLEGEITSMLEEGQDQGIINESEAEMITNIFRLDDIDADEIMTHRTGIVAIDHEMTLDETVDFVCESNYSRYPVYDENIDNIIGIIHIKDILYFYRNDENRPKAIKDINGILQKAYFIPETSKIDTVFKNMQSNNTHVEIVVDEYGQTAGLVAMEDILEKIVGNIFDEHDEVEFNIHKISDNIYHIKGLTSLEEISAECKIDFPEDDYDTLNGYLISKLDRIPENDVGTEIEDGDIKYKILAVDDKTISLVKMEITKKETEREEE